MRIVLYALTGMGNHVLEGLLKMSSSRDILVISRKEQGAFPYFDAEYLYNMCNKHGVRCELDVWEGGDRESRIVSGFIPDVIICATYSRKITSAIRTIPLLGCYNIHSSLLPHYRGATPTAWTLLYGEDMSGITIHGMTDAIDAGDIFHQSATAVGGMNDGELRHSLARLAAREVPSFLRKLAAGKCVGVPQESGSGSLQPHILSEEGCGLLRSGKFKSENIIRALTPFPGAQVAADFLG